MGAALTVPHEEGRAALVGALEDFRGALAPLDDHALLAASRCWGWTVVERGTPTHDAATYWQTCGTSTSRHQAPRCSG